MKLASLLTPEQVILDLKGDDAVDALRNIVDYLVTRDFLKKSIQEEVLGALYAREDSVGTGLGSSVAIPHAFTDAVDETVAVFARSEEGVDFEAIDNAPVHFIIFMLIPSSQRNKHLQTLAAIAKMFKTCGVRQHLNEADNAESVIRIIDSCDNQ